MKVINFYLKSGDQLSYKPVIKPYWEKTLKDLCAMVKQLGIPTWFASFSAADRRWTEIAKSIVKMQGKELPEECDWSTHCEIINSHPVVAAAMPRNL